MRYLVAAITGLALLASDATPAAAARPCEVTSIAGGNNGYCAVRVDGSVSCWGDYGLDSPAGEYPMRHSDAGPFASVFVGSDGNCAIRNDGSVSCWQGEHGSDPGAPAPAPPGSFSSLALADGTSCGLHVDGTLACWNNGDPQTPSTPLDGTFVEFAGRCGRRADHTVECIDGGSPDGLFSSLSNTGARCGIRDSGVLGCWGSDAPALPDGSYVQASFFADPALGGCAIDAGGKLACFGDYALDPPAGTFRHVAFRVRDACAIRTDGELVCWPQVSRTELPPSQPVVAPIADMALGGDPARHMFTCALSGGGNISCWGNSDFTQTDAPSGKFMSISAGWYHACGLRDDGTIACWGDFAQKQTSVPAGRFRQLSASGFFHSCAVRDDGTLACWGDGNEALEVPAGEFLDVAAGGLFACARRPDWTAECFTWPEAAGYVPAEIAPPGGAFTQLSVSQYGLAPYGLLACGIRTDGHIECWGNAEYGLLDPPAGRYVQVAVGIAHACALRADGAVVCWGDGFPQGTFPDQAPGPYVAIRSGYRGTCGVRADGDVRCWGFDQTLSVCQPQVACGNGVVDDGEQCDDGNVDFVAGDACTSSCTWTACGQPVSASASAPRVSDALFVLQAAVGLRDCAPLVCDADGSLSVSVGDALAVLRRSVGLDAALDCPAHA